MRAAHVCPWLWWTDEKKMVNMIEPSVLCALGGGHKPLRACAPSQKLRFCERVCKLIQKYYYMLTLMMMMRYVYYYYYIYGNLYTIHTRVCLLFHVYIVNSNYAVCVNKLYIQYKRFIYLYRVHMQCGAAAGKQTPTHLST